MLCTVPNFSAPDNILPPDLDKSPHLRFAESLLRLRTEKWELMCYGAYLFRKLVMDHFSDVVHYDDLLNFRINEVRDILHNRHYPEDTSAGREGFVLQIADDGVGLIVREPQRVASFARSEIKEIRGTCAQPGKAVGRVKIVLTPHDSPKVSPGDILVTTMSTPDFLPAMMKAAAFVTDIGGITCHAAIVSREMKRPCVIGTKIATKALRDGDLVEVDAATGTITILERAPD